MIIPVTDYKITQNDVPVLTRADSGTYIFTNCWLNTFNTESENITNILSDFGFRDNILTSIRQYGHSPKYIPVLHILTNSNLQTPDFYAPNDVLAVALFLEKRENKPAWLDFFEVNYKYQYPYYENQKYKRVGESALNACQKEYISQGIQCRSNFFALKFYSKCGFKRIDERELFLHWETQR